MFHPRKIILDDNTKVIIVSIECDHFICQIVRFDWACCEPESIYQDEAEASTLNTLPQVIQCHLSFQQYS